MTVLRTLACVCVLLLSATEAAAGEAWRIVQSAGSVKAGGGGFMPAAVQPNQTLPSDAWVETGAAGRVVLVRGLETIALGPNSRVQLPSEEVNGNTQVLQTLGSALYQVGKQKAPHFQVDTPYLAAVVKGTTFTVTVTDASSSVDVTEGLVQVTTPDGSDAEFVRPGFSGVVSKHDSGNVVVVNSPEAPAAPEVAPSDAGDAAVKEETDVKSDASEGTATGEPTIIAAAIGDVVLDMQEVSGGLATSKDAPAIVAGDKDGAVVDATKEEEKDPAKVDSSPSVLAEPSGGGGPGNGKGGGPSASGGGGPISLDIDLGGSSGNGGGPGSGGPGSGGGSGNGNGGGPGGKIVAEPAV
jgi:hypothetical protein